MPSGAKQTTRRIRRLPGPGLLLLLLLGALIAYSGLALCLSRWRTRQFMRDVANLPGSVNEVPPDWASRPHLTQLAPHFPQVDGVWVYEADVDDRFVIRAVSVGELKYLHVRGSGVTDMGVETLSGEQSLEDVALQETSVTDDAVAGLAQLPALRRLSVYSGRTTFSDTAFESLRRAPRLNSLAIGPAVLTEEGAAELAQSPGLERLRIDGGRVDGAAFQHLGRLNALSELWLDAQLDPEFNPLPQLRMLTNLQALALPTPAIDDRAARDLCRFGHLRTLSLCGTSIGDETVRRLSETEYPGARLETQELDGTGVTSASLDYLKRFPRLRRVSVKDTQFSEAAAAAFCRQRRSATVLYGDNAGNQLEMTWDRVHRETSGSMRWPERGE